MEEGPADSSFPSELPSWLASAPPLVELEALTLIPGRTGSLSSFAAIAL